MGLCHDFHCVCDKLARRQTVFHAGVIHGYAVTNSYRVELEGHSSGMADAFFDSLGEFPEVYMAGDDFGKRQRDLFASGSARLYADGGMRGGGAGRFAGGAARGG